MPIPRTCTRCDAKTWIIFNAKPWCREHFLTETTAAEDLAGDEQVSHRG